MISLKRLFIGAAVIVGSSFSQAQTVEAVFPEIKATSSLPLLTYQVGRDNLYFDCEKFNNRIDGAGCALHLRVEGNGAVQESLVRYGATA